MKVDYSWIYENANDKKGTKELVEGGIPVLIFFLFFIFYESVRDKNTSPYHDNTVKRASLRRHSVNKILSLLPIIAGAFFFFLFFIASLKKKLQSLLFIFKVLLLLSSTSSLLLFVLYNINELSPNNSRAQFYCF